MRPGSSILAALILVLTLVTGLSGCRDDDGERAAALELTVRGLTDAPVAGAGATLFGLTVDRLDTLTGRTDERGTVVFEPLALGTYELTVRLPDLGRDYTAPITIAGDSLRRELFYVDDVIGRDPGIYPVEYPGVVSAADSVYLSAIIDDDRTPAAEVLVVWVHERRAGAVEVFRGYPAAFNEVNFVYGGLEPGINAFVVTATDTDGRTASRRVVIRAVE